MRSTRCCRAGSHVTDHSSIPQISGEFSNLWINKLWYMYSYLPNNVTRPLRFRRSMRIRDSYRWEAGNCSWLSQNSLHNLKLSMDNPVTPVCTNFISQFSLFSQNGESISLRHNRNICEGISAWYDGIGKHMHGQNGKSQWFHIVKRHQKHPVSRVLISVLLADSSIEGPAWHIMGGPQMYFLI